MNNPESTPNAIPLEVSQIQEGVEFTIAKDVKIQTTGEVVTLVHLQLGEVIHIKSVTPNTFCIQSIYGHTEFPKASASQFLIEFQE